MTLIPWRQHCISFDERRDLIIPGPESETLDFCVTQFLQIAKASIAERGRFTVALSGGQTPHAIFQRLSNPIYRSAIDWSNVWCFWSDERSVPPDHPDSNYFNTMLAGLSALPLQPEHLFRMHAEANIEENAQAYEKAIRLHVPSLEFDLVMLGMGEDGHTASLFPFTQGLYAQGRLVVANEVPQKNTWRMSMTYACIHMAKTISIYIMGAKKAEMVALALLGPYDPDRFPVQRIGIPTHKALWILDDAAAARLPQKSG